MEAAMHHLKTRCGYLLALVGLVVLAVALARPASTVGQAQGSVTAFEGAQVIVGDGRAPIENAVFLVNGTQITQVGRAGQVTIPAGATRVNLAGKTVMPAIIDTHTHLSQTREMLLNDLRRRAYYGVGAALSLGQDTTDVLFQVRAETAAGKIPGAARFYTAGRGITGPEPGRTTAPHWVSTVAEARQAVDEEVAKRVDIVKFWVDDRLGAVKKLTPDIYSAIIDEAHKKGVRTITHIYTLEDAKGTLRAGVDAYAHGVRDKDLDDEFMALVKQHPNLVLEPNMPDRGVKVDLSWLRASVPAADFARLETANKDDAKAHEFWSIQARNLAKMNAAGARIVVGTDGNTPYAPHVEMEDMVAAGMTPMQVLTAATRNGAQFLRMIDAGTIESNKSADFIVLDANPLDNITNTRKLAAVYLRGAIIDRKPFNVTQGN
jgi:imidazolonepropionase-like amidohydrolase